MPNCIQTRQFVACNLHCLKALQNSTQLPTQKGRDTYTTWEIVHKLCTAHDVKVCDVPTLILGVHDIYLHWTIPHLTFGATIFISMCPILRALVILQAEPTNQQEQGLAPDSDHIRDVDELHAYKKGPNPMECHSSNMHRSTNPGPLYKENSSDESYKTKHLWTSEHLRTNSIRERNKICSSNIVSEGADLTGLDCETRNSCCVCIVNFAYCVKKTDGFPCTLIGNSHSIFLSQFEDSCPLEVTLSN